jgi:hypothetical protein
VQEAAERLIVKAAASRERMRKVIKEHGGTRRREIDLIDPSVFTARLPLNEPCVVEKAFAFDIRVEVKSLRFSLGCHLPVFVGRPLFPGCPLVIPEILEAIAPEQGWERKRWRLVERVTIDPQFPAVPEAVSTGVPQARRGKRPEHG